MKRYRQIGQIITFVLILGAFVLVVHDFLTPVIFGLLVSLVFRPIYRWLMSRLRQRRKFAAAVSTLVVFCCVVIPMVLIGIFIVKDVAQLARSINRSSPQTIDHPSELGRIPMLENMYYGLNKFYSIPPDVFIQQTRSFLSRLADWGENFVTGILGSIAKVIISMVFFLIAFYFGLLDGPQLVQFLKENSPFSAHETDILLRTTSGICNAVVLGSFLAGVVQGTIIGTAYWILGIPNAFIFGCLTALFGMIPLIGSAPTGIGGAIYLLMIGKPVQAIIMLGAFGIAGVSDNIVKPLVLKGRMSLHPFLGLMSVLGGIKAFGFAGIFLGPLITALTITLLQLFHHRAKILREQSTETAE